MIETCSMFYIINLILALIFVAACLTFSPKSPIKRKFLQQKTEHDLEISSSKHEEPVHSIINLTTDLKNSSRTLKLDINKMVFLKSIKDLYDDCKTKRISYKIALSRIWKIVKVWFIIYIIIAVPLWCSKGWCCCFLFCKFFEPEETIQDAKFYLQNNPLGVLKTCNKEIQYKPTDYEIKCYEKFDHILRTI